MPSFLCEEDNKQLKYFLLFHKAYKSDLLFIMDRMSSVQTDTLPDHSS